MANNISQYEALIKTFAEDYLAKIYYYCLKKTSNETEAEDLSSDITLNILTALGKGTIPANFSAWVWKIAHNRYAAWSTRKRVNRERFHNLDEKEENEANQLTSGDNIETAIVERETLSLLRRELSFIGKEYREILVAFYIDDLKVKTIAETLNVPTGTITSKLNRARKILKEGMNMAREFGVRSYKPEEVKFTVDGSHDASVALERPLPKNIVLETHGNPSTLEQLSVEIGVAMPYMEDEVKRLVEAELLVEEKGKYVTNFLIASKDAQLEIYNAQRKKSKERSGLFNQIVSDILPQLHELGIAGKLLSDNDFKWTILSILADKMNESVAGYMGWPHIFERKNGQWGIMGYEIHDLITENLTVNSSMNGGGDQGMLGHRFVYGGYHKEKGFYSKSTSELRFLSDVIKNQRNMNSFSVAEKSLWNSISQDGLYARADNDGNLLYNFVIFMMGDMKKFEDIIKSHSAYDKLQTAYSELFDEVKAILLKHSDPRFKDTIDYYVSDFMEHNSMMVINDAVEDGWLTAPENMDNSAIGEWVEVYSPYIPIGLKGKELIEYFVGPFELSKEQCIYNRECGIFLYWKKLKLLGSLPREYESIGNANAYRTMTKGDVVLTSNGELYIDVGSADWGRPEEFVRAYYITSIDGYEEVYGELPLQHAPFSLKGDAFIEYVVGGPFEFGEEQIFINKEGVEDCRWRNLKLSAPLPREYPMLGYVTSPIYVTEKEGDVIFESRYGGLLYIDIGTTNEGQRKYTAVHMPE